MLKDLDTSFEAENTDLAVAENDIAEQKPEISPQKQEIICMLENVCGKEVFD